MGEGLFYQVVSSLEPIESVQAQLSRILEPCTVNMLLASFSIRELFWDKQETKLPSIVDIENV